jgi:hypothetical protein
MATKRETKAQRHGRETAELETVLHDIAIGANGGYPLEEPESGQQIAGMGLEHVGRFLNAVSVRFELGKHAPQGNGMQSMALEFHNWDKLDSIETLAEHLHRAGVRA